MNGRNPVFIITYVLGLLTIISFIIWSNFFQRWSKEEHWMANIAGGALFMGFSLRLFIDLVMSPSVGYRVMASISTDLMSMAFGVLFVCSF